MSAENRLKSCLILGGEYRTFEVVGLNLREFIEANQLDVYCHIWSTDESEIQTVQEVLNPKGFLAENPLHYKPLFLEVEKRIRKVNPKEPNQDKVWQNASMHYSRRRAFDMVEEDYELCYFSRYDVLVKSFHLSGKVVGVVSPQEESYGLVSDIFGIFPFKHANQYFLYQDFEALHSKPFEEEFLKFLWHHYQREEPVVIHSQQRYCPHMLLLRNLFLHKIPRIMLDLPIYLVRKEQVVYKELFPPQGIE